MALEVRGSLKLQNGGLRALEEAETTSYLRNCSVKFGRFLRFCGVSRWLPGAREVHEEEEEEEEEEEDFSDGRVLDASGLEARGSIKRGLW